jgi:outer membrane protein assembly factor BamB
VVVSTGNGSAGEVAAYDAADGADLWTVALGDDVDSSPAVVDGVVYVGRAGGDGDELVAITGDSPATRLEAFALATVAAVTDGAASGDDGSDDGRGDDRRADAAARIRAPAAPAARPTG